ncbi:MULTISPECIES: helix-turn-helix domain-containing protein [Mesoflavibacter]|uniref:XRE family transcriptional regulator n=1 Tax=Mesoflavibacter zeaxanthinifaciens subsp. sabulilitoris TaxID=1520893 RepID=A0A2T1NGL8_9FLAO|nr:MULTISPECIES: helix-turn-helix transcriptional regulator [Mesoflavibacter]MBB3122903.1 transcriptional regulator with XRE-family HTH domain [Mesoflavibacter zeaxanthinifaciens subsp. sabulilitoris]PSG92021.1 XRE family transcriptional regulator [Mesoflavibacter zeaxanthinifaciens subsp. sabulilitoris]UAB75199.1 helix-turn-helix transcriptional regulator [Mesoflavibacter sp. SCSIO 43206]
MINNTEFAKRLQKVIDYYGESGSSFAEKIGVQRSSISHILSGRNKPSLEFVLKVLSSYPEVELYWLLNGKGNFPAEKNSTEIKSEIPTRPESQNLFSEVEEKTQETNSTSISRIEQNSKKEIDRIVIFYKDGSFQNFENS